MSMIKLLLWSGIWVGAFHSYSYSYSYNEFSDTVQFAAYKNSSSNKH